jgi:hypothetical protein
MDNGKREIRSDLNCRFKLYFFDDQSVSYMRHPRSESLVNNGANLIYLQNTRYAPGLPWYRELSKIPFDDVANKPVIFFQLGPGF